MEISQPKFKRLRPAAYIVSCFAVAFFSLAVIFTAGGIGFWSSKSIMISDMKMQYIHFFMALRNGDVLYTDTLALSGSFAGTFAYYLSSPFSPIVFLFRRENLDYAILLIIYLKLSLAASSFCFMQYRITGLTGPSLLIFPQCYALMSFCCFFFINVFWLDSLILLPLLVLCTLKLIESRASGAMPLLLAILFISNFYISYITGLFILLFMVTECAARGYGVKDILQRTVKLAGYALLALAMSSFLLLSAFRDFYGSFSSVSFDNYSGLNFTFKQFILKLFPGSYDSIGNAAAPTIFSGTVIFILSSAFFLRKDTGKREKLCYAGLIAVMLLSFQIPSLDRVWHAFSYPNAFAYRYAFCFSFLLIYLAVKTFTKLESLPPLCLYSWLAVPLLCLLLYAKLAANLSSSSVIVIILSVFCFVLLLLLIRQIKRPAARNLLASALVILNLTELILNGGLILTSMQKEGGEASYFFPPHSEWAVEYAAVTELLEYTKDKGIYRVGNNTADSFDEAASFRYRGVSVFSSCYPPKLQMLYSKLGYTSAFKGCSYREGSPRLDALFAVRWLLSDRAEVSGYHQVAEKNGRYLLEADSLPLNVMFPVSDDIFSLSLTGSSEENTEKLFEILKPDPFKVDLLRWNRRSLSGYSDAPDGFVMQTTIPYNTNYTVYIDSTAVASYETLDALLAFEVPAGAHAFEVRYIPKDFYAGTAVSVAAVILYLCLCYISRRRRKRT